MMHPLLAPLPKLSGLLNCVALAISLLLSSPAVAAADGFAFGFVAHPFGDALADESDLQQALRDMDQENLAFVVVGGIKSGIEPCTDQIYEHRRSVLNQAKNGVIVSLAASDWSDCRYRNDRSAALERLNRLRELFFADDMSLGASKIPLIRQSTNAKFRDFAENARWEVGGIMFATINLPANNNRYLNAAGRNSEFEDRLMANRDWLQRIVMYAKRSKHRGIVIFCDGSPLTPPPKASNQRDGFGEIRQQMVALATRFPGPILLVHNQDRSTPKSAGENIRWTNNLGDLAVESAWISVQTSPTRPLLFSVSAGSAEKPEPGTK